MTIPQSELPIYDGDLGWAFGCSRRGASHIRSETPCQDAYSIWSGSAWGTPYLIVAVADGHGDERHDLSQYGSALAVKGAVDELLSLHVHFDLKETSSALMSSFKADFPRRVGRRWRRYVLEDIEAHRAAKGSVDSQKVRQVSDSSNRSDAGQEIFSRYGTTLLTGLVTQDTVLIGQIGDGDILLIRPDGSLELPFQRDMTPVGTATYSLSSPEASKLWQTATLERGEGGLLLMVTDGLANAFTDETQFHIFAKSLQNRINQFGMPKVAASIPHWLESYSERGSGDDITLTLVCINPEPVQPTGEKSTPDEQIAENPSTKEAKNDTRNRKTDKGRDAEHQPDRQAKTG